jgi:Tfp pilus assembly protein PilF
MPSIRERLKGFVQIYPDNGPANYYYAMSLLQQPDAAKAQNSVVETLLNKAIAADPQLYEAHFQLGVLYQDGGKYTEAIAEFNKTIQLRPDYSRAHYHLVLLYNRTHQKELADQQLAILKQIKQEDAKADDMDDHPGQSRQKTAAQKSN